MQLSSDGTTWTDVFAVDTYLREGWNTYTPNSNHHRTFDAEYIYVSTGAFFEAETETNRYTSKFDFFIMVDWFEYTLTICLFQLNSSVKLLLIHFPCQLLVNLGAASCTLQLILGRLCLRTLHQVQYPLNRVSMNDWKSIVSRNLLLLYWFGVIVVFEEVVNEDA